MSSPQVQLRRSSRKSILPSPSVKCNEIDAFTPAKRRTTIEPIPIISSKPSFKRSSTLDLKKPDFKSISKKDLILSKFCEGMKTTSYNLFNIIGPESTPNATVIPHFSTPKALHIDPVMARLQRDLNSPSAGARVRANKALKSPNFRKQVYCQFDVPHERLDLITEEERKPMVPKTVQEIFQDCKVYVEVRSGDDNRSAGIKNRLLRDGINVNEKLYKDTTHVIFKDGLLSTYKNAIKLGIPVTTVLWIDACKTHKRLVDASKFKISNLDRYEHPELYPRLRRQKSMQPEIRKISTIPFTKAMTQEEQQKEKDELFDEINEENEDIHLTMQNDKSLEKTSCQTPQPMDIDESSNANDKWNRDQRRITTFTPNMMEQTGVAAKMILDRRRTLFTPQLMQRDDSETSPESSIYNSFKNNSIVFNSANRIAKNCRRSMYDISMNILDLNCKAVNQQSQEQNTDRLPSSSQKTVERITVALKTSEKKHHTQVVKPPVIRKRKLFTDEHESVDDFKENNDKSHNKTITNSEKKPKRDNTLVPSYKTPQLEKKSKAKIDRRNTLAYFKTEKPKPVVAAKAKTPVKPAASLKVIVCTNMSFDDKKIVQAVNS